MQNYVMPKIPFVKLKSIPRETLKPTLLCILNFASFPSTIFPVSIEIHLTNSYLFSITSVHARKPQAPLSNRSLPSSVSISLTSKKIPSRNRQGSPKWVHSQLLTAQNNLSLPKSRSSSLPPRRAAVGWIANTSSLLETAISSWINRQLIQPLISNRKKYQWRQK